MFSIDFLKGEGIPLRSKPVGLLLVVLSTAIPVIVALVMLGNYFFNNVVLTTMRRDVSNLDAKILSISKKVKLQQITNKEYKELNECYDEVAETIVRYTQWSPILEAIAQNIPEGLILNNLIIESNEIDRKRVPGRYTKESVDSYKIERTLRFELREKTESEGEYTPVIKDFIEHFSSSPQMTSLIKEYKPSVKYITL